LSRVGKRRACAVPTILPCVVVGTLRFTHPTICLHRDEQNDDENL
jgi:hypothetical protein